MWKAKYKRASCIICGIEPTEDMPVVLAAIDRPIGYKHYKGAICAPCLNYLIEQDDERIRAEAARDLAANFDSLVGSDYP